MYLFGAHIYVNCAGDINDKFDLTHSYAHAILPDVANIPR
jgi:hypothetical protein